MTLSGLLFIITRCVCDVTKVDGNQVDSRQHACASLTLNGTKINPARLLFG